MCQGRQFISLIFLCVFFLITPSGVLGKSLSCDNRANNTSKKLLECVTLEGVREHQAAFQAFADGNGGNRSVGTPGYSESISYVIELLTAAGYDVTLQEFGPVTSYNVIAESRWGDPNNVIMVGAHLDSVISGPGVQDNGSGSAAILEVAMLMANVKTANKLSFTWWGAEESGLVGSMHFINNLTSQEKDNISMYLNFDMIGSPNFVRFVYSGEGVPCSIQSFFEGFYASQGLAYELISPTAYSSAHQSFINAGIPSGGLFTGADGIKTAEQAAIFGGTAADQYDPCFHLACDTFDNVSLQVLEENAEAIAAVILHQAMKRHPKKP